MYDLAVPAIAGLIAGAMNGIAGGGSFVTLPALMAVGVPAINANATSTLALVPGALSSAYAYRKDFQGLPDASFRALAGLSIAGGVCGAVLLIVTPQQIFAALVPWLMLFATVVFAFGRQVGAILRARISINPSMIYVSQFFLGVYGGYFGGAVGIMMLAAWSLLTTAKISAMQALRNVLGAMMNATATVLFIWSGLIWWPQALAMLVGAVCGGYFAARFARRLDPARARIAISCLNAVITGLVFWRTYG